jgi:hypothetical protein
LPAGDGTPLAALTPREQAQFWEQPEAVRQRILTWLGLGDRICLGEARKLLAPPPPAESPPWSLGTSELLAGLPGRPDRVAAAAGRLCEELGDPKSYNFYRSVAQAVSARRSPVSSLLEAWRQGMGPKSVNRGAVFVYAWKREAGRVDRGRAVGG